jgi:hypothetical protein
MNMEPKVTPADEQVYGINLTSSQVEDRLSRLMNSPGGLQKIAQQMLSPLKRDLLFEGRIRQIYQTYKLALGEEAVFDADLDVPAASISVEGLPEQLEVRSDRIRIETSPITVRPMVRWNESNFRKFDVLNRAQERGKASIQFQEDARGFALLQYAATLTNQPPVRSLIAQDLGIYNTTTAANNNATIVTTSVGAGRLMQESLVEGIVDLRGKLLVANKIFMHPFRGKDLMLFNTSVSGSGGAGIFAPNFQDQALKAGRVGSIWGVEVLEDIIVPTSQVYVLAPADYLGVMAVRTDVSVETLKDSNKFADVFAIWEDVGFVIRYAKGICQIQVS